MGYSIIGFLITIGVLVTIHEWGHFYLARLCKVGVVRFSVGFGKILWSRTDRHGTQWAISAIPLGGYVKMIDERESPVPPEKIHLAYNRKSVGARMAIVLAGPVANLLLAFLLLFALYVFGIKEVRPILGTPSQHSLAFAQGVRGGEEVLAINGKAVSGWGDIRQAMVSAGVDHAHLTFQLRIDDGVSRSERTINMDVSTLLQGERADIGIIPPFPKMPPIIHRVVRGSPAEQAGLIAGDEIIAINDQRIDHWQAMAMTIQNAPDQRLMLTIGRPREGLRPTQNIAVYTQGETLSEGIRVGRIGIEPDPKNLRLEDRYFFRQALPFDQALLRAGAKTWEAMWLIPRFIGGIIDGRVSWRHLNGPVAIADVAGRSLEDGVNSFIQLLAAVSVSLGMMNLLPLPVLDGGHLMLLIYEAITRQTPTEKALEWLTRAGLVALFLMMALAIFNDVGLFLR